MSFYLIPIVGVAAGALLLGERLDPRQWVGAVIVLAAILAILRQPSAQAVETPATSATLQPGPNAGLARASSDEQVG